MHIVDYQIIENEKDILQAAEDFAYRNCDRMENPDGHYHGNMNIRRIKPFNNYEDAYNYIEKYTKDRFYYDMAVQFHDNNSLPETEKVKALILKRHNLSKQKETYEKENLLYKRKSTFFGCPTCKSKIARQYFHNKQRPELSPVTCPVCQTDLRSETVLKRINNFKDKIKDLTNQIKEENAKPREGAPIKWLVKIEIHG